MNKELQAWYARHNADLDAECKFSRGDRVLVTVENIEDLDYLPAIAEALRTGTRIGTVHTRIKSLYNGGVEPRYEVLLDDCPSPNVQYGEAELSLVDSVEVVALDKAIAEAEENVTNLKKIRDRIATRITT
jgi:hypothetical protein